MNKKKPFKKSNNTPICPYCGNNAILKPATFLFKEKAEVGFVWVCSSYPHCDSYSVAHDHNKSQKGSLANRDLRLKRLNTHKIVDLIWKERIMTRKETYEWIKVVMGKSSKNAHIGFMDINECEFLIAKAKTILKIYSNKQNNVV